MTDAESMASAAPAIAVIIPTYNRAGLVERAIESVLEQSMTDFELIVVDDGSTDDSVERLSAIDDPRLRVIEQENRGVCAARNTGIEAATAGFVTWLDSDDLAEQGWLAFFVEAKSDGAMLASCGIRSIATDGSSTILVPSRHGPVYGNLEARFLPGAMAIDRALLVSVGAFRDGLKFSEHTDLGLRLGGRALEEAISTSTTEEPLVRWFRRDDVVDPQVRHDSAVTILEADGEHLRRSSHLMATYLAIAGSTAAKLGRRRVALKYSLKAAMTQPKSFRHWGRLLRVLIVPSRTGAGTQ